MDNYNVIENLDKLPPLLQFIIILVWLLGVPVLAEWRSNRKIKAQADASQKLIKAQSDAQEKASRTASEAIAKAEMLETQQIKMRLEFDHQKNQLDFLRETSTQAMDSVKVINTQWQNVYNVASERKHQDDERQYNTLDKLNSTIDTNSRVLEELSTGLAIQLGNVVREVGEIRKDNEQTNKVIRATFKATNRNVDQTFEAVVTMRDSMLQLINNVEKKVDSLNNPNCDDFKQMLETMKIEILARLPVPVQPTTQPIPVDELTASGNTDNEIPLVQPDNPKQDIA
jgi:hypothetical protein